MRSKMSLRGVLLMYGLVLMEHCVCEEQRRFPNGFQFGAATAAYQIEGAWNATDKAMSIWDRLSHIPGSIADGSSGDIADDSYHLYTRDVEMLKELGVDFYRFSISWPRLLPNGFANKISEDGKRYYNELINELLRNDIKPMVTLYHWDLPQNLQDLGGWANPLIAEWFEDYARVAYDLFADRVKLWVTINEPLISCAVGYGQIIHAPAVGMTGIADFMCTKHMLLAHAKAWRLFDEEYRPKWAGINGIVNKIFWMEPQSESEEDVRLSEEANQLYTGLYSHPIYSAEGGWPAVVAERVAARSAAQGYPRSRLPALSQDEIELIRGTYDFYGLNHYTSKLVRPADSSTWVLADEIGVDFYYDKSWPTTMSYWFQVYPLGFRKSINFVKERYGNPQILITENGFSTGTGLDDDFRVQYYRDYLNQVLDAIYEDGCNVTHYTAWSLMDNFEWADGYNARFGLYEVDYEDPARTRRPRKSALVYKEIVRSKTIDPEYNPVSADGINFKTEL